MKVITKYLKQLVLIIIGLTLLAISLNMFFKPHQIAAGGVSGISILVEYTLNIPAHVTVFTINGIFLLLGLVFLGKEFLLKTVVGSTLLPVIIDIVPETMAASDTILSVIVGSTLVAVGVSILYKVGASSGGTTIPPMIFKKLFGLNTSIGLLVTDAIVVTLSLFIFGLESFLYAILTIVLTSLMMDYIDTGLNRKKALYIISEHHEKISADILGIVSRGVTIVPTEGAYTHEQQKMLMVIVSDRDYRQVRAIIDEHDKNAFVVIYSVANVQGLGFSYHSVVR